MKEEEEDFVERMLDAIGKLDREVRDHDGSVELSERSRRNASKS